MDREARMMLYHTIGIRNSNGAGRKSMSVNSRIILDNYKVITCRTNIRQHIVMLGGEPDQILLTHRATGDTYMPTIYPMEVNIE